MQNFLFWLPRAVVLLLAGFFLLMGLDVFSMPGTFFEQLLEYLIHSVPAILLLLALGFLWKRPLAAGAIFIVLALVGMVFFNTWRNIVVFLVVTVLPILVGLILIRESKMGKK